MRNAIAMVHRSWNVPRPGRYNPVFICPLARAVRRACRRLQRETSVTQQGMLRRIVARIVITSHVVLGIPLAAQQRPSPLPTAVATAPTAPSPAAPAPKKKIVPNRKKPVVSAPDLAVHFGDAPATEALTHAHLLPEPLHPAGSTPTLEDNIALARTLEAYAAEGFQTGLDHLERFLNEQLHSPWRATILANVATLRARDGYYTRAARYWEDAWEIARFGENPDDRAVADYAISERLTQAATFGQIAVLEKRLNELEGRVLRGTPRNKVNLARESLWFLTHKHEFAIFSGPEALKVLAAETKNANAVDVIKAYRPPHEGTSLTALRDLGRRAGLGLEMRFVATASEVPVPSVIHLKSEHFSAVVARRNDGLVLRDGTLGGEVFLSGDALASEASGYALALSSSVEAAGRLVPVREGDAVLGHCTPGLPWDDEGCPCRWGGRGPGMPTYTLHPMTAAVLIDDTPLTYRPPVGPTLSLTLHYNHRSNWVGSTQAFGNVGPGWRLEWLSYVVDNNTTAVPPYEWTEVVLRGVGTELTNSISGYTHWKTHAELVQVDDDPPRYERTLPDGTIEVYTFPDRAASLPNRKIFLTEVIDPQGNTLTYDYDSSLRLISVTDAIGQVTTLDYEASDPLLLTKVTDPFGRYATLTYDAAGRLQTITDVVGMASRFAYADDDFLVSMTTPYGTTTFTNGDTTGSGGYRRVDATDPEGGTERVEFHLTDTADQDSTAPSGEVPTGFSSWNADLHLRNSVYWSKLAMAEAPGNVAAAVVTHWLMKSEMAYAAHALSRAIPHSVKRPLETRIWYKYPDQSSSTPQVAGTGTEPSVIGRVLESGASQISEFSYNAKGKVTARTDPAGRQTTYVYDSNGIDLLEVRQIKSGGYDVLAAYADYTSQHLPETMIDAGGRTTTLTYNAVGRVLTVTNALDETTTYSYQSGTGYLMSVTRPVSGATTTYTYDDYGRIETVTDADDYTLTLAYDALNRVTRQSYPDDTFEEFTYARLDLLSEVDRLGRVTRHFYDRMRRRTATRDPLGRVIRQEWCGCGSLQALVDGNGNRTSWERDILGRVTTETRADGTTETTYTYDATGRLETVTDPEGQVTTYTHTADDQVATIGFTNETIATPDVSYAYDTVYPRVTEMDDGSGTTTYAYVDNGELGAGQVATVDGPLSNDVIAYTYDELGRVVERSINGSANTATWTYDELGRVTSETNVLGTFDYTYDGVSSRLETVTYPNDQTSTYSYYGTTQDLRLQTIHHKYPNASTLSKFDYTYDTVGNILTWRQQVDSDAVLWKYGYDAANQLTQAVKWDTETTPSILKRYAYGYDPAGSRTYEQIDDEITAATHDSLNRLTAHAAGGALTFAGTINEAGTVTIQGRPATVDASNAFRGTATTAGGTNTVTIVATDASANQTAQQYEVEVSGGSKTFTYDANGNLTSDGTRTFEWDARNQLVAVNVGTHRSEYSYDGLQQRVRVVEKENSATESDIWLLWCNKTICEHRDSEQIQNRVFDLGVSSTAPRFYTRDQLGTVRDVTGSSSTRVASYEYDPFGRQTLAQGSEPALEGFAAYSPSSANVMLALYRQYDPALGRWLSEDPAGLTQGPNLYLYVGNIPTRGIDPFGDAECEECAIWVKCRMVDHPVKWLGGSHCFAELKLEDGTIVRREGGRGGPNDSLLVGYLNAGSAFGWLFWMQDPSPCDQVHCVANTGNGNQGTYSPWSNNSNQYLRRVLATCGYRVNVPDYFGW